MHFHTYVFQLTAINTQSNVARENSRLNCILCIDRNQSAHQNSITKISTNIKTVGSRQKSKEKQVAERDGSGYVDGKTALVKYTHKYACIAYIFIIMCNKRNERKVSVYRHDTRFVDFG